MNKVVAIVLAVFALTALGTLTITSTNASAADSWTVIAPMNQARGRLGVVAVNDAIFAFGGDAGVIGGLVGAYKFVGSSLVVNITEEYNLTTNTWVFRAPMPTARDHFGTVVYQNKIYCIGGMSSDRETGQTKPTTPQRTLGKTKPPCQSRAASYQRTSSTTKSTL